MTFLLILLVIGYSFYILRKFYKSIRKDIKTSEISINSRISHLNGRLNNILDSMDTPAWYKLVTCHGTHKNFVMCYMNPAFEKFFGVKKEDYIGKTDFEFWPQEIADVFYDSDIKTYNKKHTDKFVETVTDAEKSQDVTMIFQKSYFSDSSQEGVFGMMVRKAS